eukprot:CAMPEP_0172166352 /NCGR_PEP_ID=MMETSP1050-20130122/8932_1 /TAXON_ID=233186 /ORGANISM="Cryptomonas curvata, Strain CCAP979/52" /LENGTH=56 /DNA_ID=CAMNT_0012836949 /DNA_START=410 /DNA_END=577 /DNA_ORIENTATION=+
MGLADSKKEIFSFSNLNLLGYTCFSISLDSPTAIFSASLTRFRFLHAAAAPVVMVL